MTTRSFVIRSADIARCPKRSLLPAHYADDGTCSCARAEERTAAGKRIEARLARVVEDVGVERRRLRVLLNVLVRTS